MSSKKVDMKSIERAMAKLMADYPQYIDSTFQDAMAYNSRGIEYYQKGEYDKAIAEFTQALKLDPNSAGVYVLRGDAYREKGDTAGAEADFAMARELGYEG